MGSMCQLVSLKEADFKTVKNGKNLCRQFPDTSGFYYSQLTYLTGILGELPTFFTPGGGCLPCYVWIDPSRSLTINALQPVWCWAIAFFDSTKRTSQFNLFYKHKSKSERANVSHFSLQLKKILITFASEIRIA